VRPSLWLLAAQSLRLIVPGLAWLLSLGLSVNLVLHEGKAPPDPQEVLVRLGAHGRPPHLALNVLTLVPLLALLVWQRRSAATATERPADATAA